MRTTGAQTIGGAKTFSDATTFASTLGVTGNAQFLGTLGVSGDLTVNTNKFIVNATSGNTSIAGTLTGPSLGTFAIDAGGLIPLNVGGTSATTLNLGRSGQTQALLGNATVAGTLAVTGTSSQTGNATFGGTIAGPSVGTFAIDAGGAIPVNIGGTSATTLNLGRTGQTQALLGNATVAGTLAVTGTSSQTGNATFGGTITGPSAGSFGIDAGGGIPMSIGGASATTINIGRSGQILKVWGNEDVSGTLVVTGATTLGGLTVASAATFQSGVTFAAATTFQSGVTLQSTLGVTGATTLANTTVGGTLGVTGDATLGNTTLSTGKTLNVGSAGNNLNTQTAASINTGGGLTSGQALDVSVGSSLFTTGNTQDGANATRGFFYGGLTGSYKGATTFSSTGNFTGTLVALTADSTTAGTILGISGQSLTTGKAIDVSLGTLYSGTTDTVAGYTTGAVNVRAQSFTGNVFNVSASGAGGVNANLANFKSTQLAGQVLNVSALSLTSGRAVAVTLGAGGTGFYLNTAAGYTGSLVSLNLNGSPRFTIDQAGNTTLAGTLTVQGQSITGSSAGIFSIDNGNASAINIGGATATTINIGRTGQLTALLGNATVAGTLGVSGGSFNLAEAGRPGSTFVSTSSINNEDILTLNVFRGGTNLTRFQVNQFGDVLLQPAGDATVSIGTNKFVVTAASGNTTIAGTLGVTGNTALGGTLTGPAAATFNIDAGGANQISIGGTNATDVLIGRVGQYTTLRGNLFVNGTMLGNTGGAFNIDNNAANTINIGGTTATTLNLGRTGQTQTLLGTVRIASLTPGALKTDASGNVSAVAPGTAGFVLTSTGTDFVSQIPVVTVLDKNTTTTSVTNTTVETTLYTVSVPGGTLSTNHRVRVRMGGTYICNAVGCATLTLRIKYGATTMYAEATPTIVQDADTRAWWLEFELAANGATNSQKLIGRFEMSSTGFATTGNGDMDVTVGSSAGFLAPFYGVVAAIDSTLAQNLVVTIQHSLTSTSINFSKQVVDTIVMQ